MTTTATGVCEKAMQKNKHNIQLSENWQTTQTTFEDQVCFAFYDDVRRSVLRMAPWACCLKRATLEADEGLENLSGKAYAFHLPADYIRRVSVEDGYGRRVSFIIEGSICYSDHPNPTLVYVFDDKNVAHWDDLLVSAMVLQMAAEIAYPLTGSHENEAGFGQAAELLASHSSDETRREHRTSTPFRREWSPGLFSNRRN